MLSCCHKENVGEVIHRTRTEQREVNTAFPPREPLGGARPRAHPATCSGPQGKLCRDRPVAGVCAWKQFRFDEHHVQKDLCSAVRSRKRRLLGEARFESEELENDVGEKRLPEQHSL